MVVGLAVTAIGFGIKLAGEGLAAMGNGFAKMFAAVGSAGEFALFAGTLIVFGMAMSVLGLAAPFAALGLFVLAGGLFAVSAAMFIMEDSLVAMNGFISSLVTLTGKTDGLSKVAKSKVFRVPYFLAHGAGLFFDLISFFSKRGRYLKQRSAISRSTKSALSLSRCQHYSASRRCCTGCPIRVPCY